MLVDVDGVISLFGLDHTAPPRGFPVSVDGTPHWLAEGAGTRLTRLARTLRVRLVHGQEERAEEQLPYNLGLPGGWRHLSFDVARKHPDVHWKLATIDSFAGPDRPLAWLDDDHDARCHAWAARRAGPTLLVTTDPAVGMTDAQVSELETWASELRR